MIFKVTYNYAHAMTVLQEWFKDDIQGNHSHNYVADNKNYFVGLLNIKYFFKNTNELIFFIRKEGESNVFAKSAILTLINKDLENHEGRIQDLENKTFDIGKNVLNQANHYTDTQINKGVAKASALAGLKYLDYNPKDKWSFAVSVGHYRNANAVAVGAAYQPNENTMVHGGITVDGKVAYNLGVSVKVGGQKYINKYELAEQVKQLQSDNAELRQELAELRSMIEKR